jgi:uncharacterized protein YciI
MATEVTVLGDGAIEELRRMSYYAVIREAGPSWTDGGIAEQPDVADHAAFMHDLAGEGFVLFAGPLAGTENGLLRVLLILKADDDDEIRNRLADDPWARTDRLVITRIERWNLVVGAQRLAALA